MSTRQWSGLGRNASLLVVGLTLGLLLSLGWRVPAGKVVVETGPEPSAVWPAIDRLEAEQRELRTTLDQLRQELNRRQQAVTADTDRFQALKLELDRQQLLAGLTPVQGPGVLVVLHDSIMQPSPDVDPAAYIVHDYDLRDIVNLLWMAGSEAIAINDERLVNSSSIYCVGSTVMVNDTRLSPPYLVRAIGNPRIQQDHLRNPSYLHELREKERLHGIHFEVRELSDLSVPAYHGGFLIQHARPGE